MKTSVYSAGDGSMRVKCPLVASMTGGYVTVSHVTGCIVTGSVTTKFAGAFTINNFTSSSTPQAKLVGIEYEWHVSELSLDCSCAD